MKVLLTGASGNLGQHIQKCADFEITPLTRDNASQLEKVFTPDHDIIIHCAYDLKKKLKDEPTQILESNILLTAKLLEQAKKNKCKKFIFISSCSVYGHSSKTDELTPCAPVTLNGQTKLFNEN